MSKYSPKPMRVTNVATCDCTLVVHEVERLADGNKRIASMRKLMPGQAAILFLGTTSWIAVGRDGSYAGRAVSRVRVQNVATGDHDFTVRDFRPPINLASGSRVLVAERDIAPGDTTIASLYDGGAVIIVRRGCSHG